MIYVVVASLQEHATITTSDKICPCLCAQMGLGGGNVPMLIWTEKEVENEKCNS